MTWADPFFNSPEQALQNNTFQSLPRGTLRLVLASSLISYALAETLILQPASRNLPTESLEMLLRNALFFGFSFFILTHFIAMVAKYIHSGPVSADAIRSLTIWAAIPLHLALPLALVCWPFGVGGDMIYSSLKILILASIAMRLAKALQVHFEWPMGRSLLVAWSPVLLALIVGIVGASLMVALAASLIVMALV